MEKGDENGGKQVEGKRIRKMGLKGHVDTTHEKPPFLSSLTYTTLISGHPSAHFFSLGPTFPTPWHPPAPLSTLRHGATVSVAGTPPPPSRRYHDRVLVSSCDTTSPGEPASPPSAPPLSTAQWASKSSPTSPPRSSGADSAAAPPCRSPAVVCSDTRPRTGRPS